MCTLYILYCVKSCNTSFLLFDHMMRINKRQGWKRALWLNNIFIQLLIYCIYNSVIPSFFFFLFIRVPPITQTHGYKIYKIIELIFNLMIFFVIDTNFFCQYIFNKNSFVFYIEKESVVLLFSRPLFLFFIH